MTLHINKCFYFQEDPRSEKRVQGLLFKSDLLCHLDFHVCFPGHTTHNKSEAKITLFQHYWCMRHPTRCPEIGTRLNIDIFCRHQFSSYFPFPGSHHWVRQSAFLHRAPEHWAVDLECSAGGGQLLFAQGPSLSIIFTTRWAPSFGSRLSPVYPPLGSDVPWSKSLSIDLVISFPSQFRDLILPSSSSKFCFLVPTNFVLFPQGGWF